MREGIERTGVPAHRLDVPQPSGVAETRIAQRIALGIKVGAATAAPAEIARAVRPEKIGWAARESIRPVGDHGDAPGRPEEE